MEDGTQEPQATLGGMEQEPAAAQEQAEYVVQMAATEGVWEDIATVTVPPRTRRRSVLEKALAEADAEHKPTVDEPAQYRVLDAQSFEAIPACMEPPEPSEPVLRIG